MRWHLASDRKLLWRSWDGETVVYDDLSDETHYLEPLAAEIFESLLARAADTDALVESVGTSLGLSPDQELRRAVAAATAHLCQAGLIVERPA